METYGNIQELKSSLSGYFESRIKELESYHEKKAKEIQEAFDKKLKETNQENSAMLEEELALIKERLENNKKLDAKKEIQNLKDQFIMKVIDDIRNDSKKIVKSKKYLDMLKKQLPKDATIYADSEQYNLNDIKIDKTIVGVKAVSENVVYDFTVDSMINSKVDVLKETIAKEMFK